MTDTNTTVAATPMSNTTVAATPMSYTVAATPMSNTETVPIITHLPTALLDDPDPLNVKYYEPPYSVNRRAKLSMFSSVLKGHKVILQMPLIERMEIAEKIEQACFKHVKETAIIENIPINWNNELFTYLYDIICAKIASNFSTTNTVKNTYLIYAILDGSISIEKLPTMTAQELFPEKYVEIFDKIEISKSVKQTVTTSSMYRCRRCGEKKCTIANRYNRSLDEGVNLTITCVECGNEWNA